MTALTKNRMPKEEWELLASSSPNQPHRLSVGGFRALFPGILDAGRHTGARVRARPGLFTPEALANYPGGNVARLVAAGYRRVLAERQPCSV